MYPVAILLEPIITDSEVNQIMSQITLNINNSAVSTGNTFEIDLPQISMRNGPFRLVCVFHDVNKFITCLCLQSFIHYCGHQQQCNQCNSFINSRAS